MDLVNCPVGANFDIYYRDGNKGSSIVINPDSLIKRAKGRYSSDFLTLKIFDESINPYGFNTFWVEVPDSAATKLLFQTSTSAGIGLG
ncbi:hypothetical protein LAG90_18410 [Marinilongibacter aquaticus]|uniref:hypothetical protein n=1 Tax=Marinilongibacter aquaticus TaxID=2975157 RepID=UPI0021BD6414|nr:hypothetical protein [Marinilongibacter aquaticus]UBM58775.1 hypothetical protein LAG90_18410 [Marinilongibacter aquaticus]